MLTNKTNRFKYLIYLFVDIFLILDSVDNQSFSDDLTYCHTGVKGSDGVLEDHLDLCNQLALLCNAALACVFLLESGGCDIIALSLLKLCGILLVKLLNKGSGVLLINVLVIALSVTNECLILSDNDSKLFLDLLDLGFDLYLSRCIGIGLGLESLDLFICLSASFGDSVLVGTCACSDSLTLKVYVTGGNVIQFNYGTTGRGLSASGLTNESERFTLSDLKANVINCLEILASHTEILTKMVNF